MARKKLNVFSLSFLDAMTCGFGAVILFFMIVNANVDLRSEVLLNDRASEVNRMELRVTTGKKNLLQTKQDLSELIEEWAILRGVKDEIVSEVNLTQEEFGKLSSENSAQEELIKDLNIELATLEEESKRLSAESITPEVAGNRIRSFNGDGNRQYLTGLRMGGERIVILVDASTSMLDRTIVNILRRRNMSRDQQLIAPKWKQVVQTLDWLTTQITPGTQFQIFAFNDKGWSLIQDTESFLKLYD